MMQLKNQYEFDYLIKKIIVFFYQEKQGDISEDDTVRFKSYLMSLGIDDPVTRDAFRSDSDYYMGLAQQISDMMVAVLMVSKYHIKKKYKYLGVGIACIGMSSTT